MSKVIHTIKGNQYAYNHVWRNGRVESDYIGPVGTGGRKRKALHGGGAPVGGKRVTQGNDNPTKQGKDINNKKDNSRLEVKASGGKSTMEIMTKTGTKINIEVSGTQENPIITAKPFEIRGRKVEGNATIQHWKHKGAEEGLLFKKGDVYIQAAQNMPRIRQAINKLPNEKYYAVKAERVVNADGDKIKTGVWKIEKLPITTKGTIISEKELSRFLDGKNIDKIEIREAVKMWEKEKEPEYLKKQVEAAEWRKNTFDDDEADQGLKQAYDNAGVPKHLRNKFDS